MLESELLEDSPVSLGCMDLGKVKNVNNTETFTNTKALEKNLKGAIDLSKVNDSETSARVEALKDDLISAKVEALVDDLISGKVEALEDDLKRAMEGKEKISAKMIALENSLKRAMDLGKVNDSEASAKVKALEDILKGAMEGKVKTSAKIIALENGLKRAMEEIEMMTKDRLVYIENAEIELKRVIEDKGPEVRETLLVIKDVVLTKEVVITELNSLIIETLASKQDFLMEDSRWSDQVEKLAAPTEIISDSDSEGPSINPTDKISQLLQKSNKLKLERKQKLVAAKWKAQCEENLDEILRLRKDLGVTYENIEHMHTLLKSY
jgi:hypothetical protein